MTQEQAPKARKRVWQLTDMALITGLRMPKLVTLNWRDKEEQRDFYRVIEANQAAQYVLHEEAEEWARQNKAMEGYAKRYGLVELGADKEGANDYMPKSKSPMSDEAADELRKQNAVLLKRLEALEALRGKNTKEEK
ncbi:MAG: hypothetical protein K9N51_02465 [Candidatus Pacebacteria bacterium]|nr:hypothetical protein [Candidatus Paceibacterota bacterium]